MTTNEHRLDATLAILADASGPLTPREVTGRMRGLGHLIERDHARRLLNRLVARGLALSFGCGPIFGQYPSRMFWPTELGRSEAASLEDSRIEGV